MNSTGCIFSFDRIFTRKPHNNEWNELNLLAIELAVYNLHINNFMKQSKFTNFINIIKIKKIIKIITINKK
jgi:hypothetical protein